MYQVPRKTYRDFHSDIFPDTNGFKSELTPKEWYGGKNYPVPKISLDPAFRDGGEKPIVVSFKLSLYLITNLFRFYNIKYSISTDFKR